MRIKERKRVREKEEENEKNSEIGKRKRNIEKVCVRERRETREGEKEKEIVIERKAMFLWKNSAARVEVILYESNMYS